MKILSAALILITVYLGVKHGYAGLANKATPEESKIFTDLGFTPSLTMIFSILTLVASIMILIPQTFFAGNLLNAGMILLIIALSLKTGNFKMALIEIPFFVVPLILIWIGHPLKR